MLRCLDDARRALNELEAALQQGIDTGVEQPVIDRCPHRAAHRPGLPARLDSDPELRAFVLARIDKMTFPALADDVATSFPPERRVGKSAIHKWWRAQSRKNHPG
jgi:transposase InsO family protein